MGESTVNYSRVASFDVPADKVWEVLLRLDDRNLYRWEGQKLRPTGERSCSGTVLFLGSYYRLNAAPYDIRLSSTDSRLGLRVKPSDTGCNVIVACAVPAGSEMKESDLDAFLNRIARALRAGSGTAAAPVRPAVAETAAASAPKAAAAETSSGKAPAPERPRRTEHRPAQKKTEAPAEEKPRQSRQRSSSGSFASFLMLLLLFALIGAGIFFAVSSLRNGKVPSEMPVISDQVKGSSSVTLDTALSLNPGDSRSSIESALGKSSSGTKEASVYLSADKTEYGTPAVAVRVLYDGNTSESITVLDLSQASSIGLVTGSSLSAGSLEELQEQAGTKVSMVRSYTAGGVTYREYHFGYLDPKYNFSSAWSGQLWAKTGSDGSFQSGKGYAYDGSDPAFHSQLPDDPKRQYDDFDAYMADFNGYLSCLRFRDKPSRSESLDIIPSLALSQQIDETSLYNGTSEWKKEAGEPVWAYTAGFGIRGDFVMFSAVNTRIRDREDQLEASEYSTVHSGMTFIEVTSAMKILPTMVYIDHSYITLGYGKMNRDTNVLTEQFEFCVRLSLTDDIVESIFDNTGKQIIID